MKIPITQIRSYMQAYPDKPLPMEMVEILLSDRDTLDSVVDTLLDFAQEEVKTVRLDM